MWITVDQGSVAVDIAVVGECTVVVVVEELAIAVDIVGLIHGEVDRPGRRLQMAQIRLLLLPPIQVRLHDRVDGFLWGFTGWGPD